MYGPITSFPAQGLRTPKRLITGHNSAGESVFIKEDGGDHQSIMVQGIAAQNVFYSTRGFPVDLNQDDVEWAHETKVN